MSQPSFLNKPGKPGKPRAKPKGKWVSVRMTADQYNAFSEKASQHGGVSSLVRTLTLAFAEGRVTLRAPDGYKPLFV